MDYIVEDLDLPNLDKKKYSEIISESASRKRGYQRHGINPRLAKKKTVMAKTARKQGKIRALREAGLDTELDRFPFREDDIRYYRVKTKPKKESNAVMIFIMDVSGSMDSTKKYLARSFFLCISYFYKKENITILLLNLFLTQQLQSKLMSMNFSIKQNLEEHIYQVV